jgi:hypothetical protein
MRSRSLFVATVLGSVATLCLLACSSSEYPNPVLTFDHSQESDTFKDVKRFDIERVDSNGKTERILRVTKLPDSLDIGKTGTYQFVGTGYDATGKPVAIGRTLAASPGELLGAEIPMFFARRDRASRPIGGFAGSPMQNPVAALLSNQYIWYFDDSSDDTLETDSYSIAYWQQVTPPDRYLSIACDQVPCGLKNVVVVAGSYALAVADEWAIGIDTLSAIGKLFKPPTGMSNWSDITGGRTLSRDNGTAFLVGPTRIGDATESVLGLGVDDDGALTSVYFESNTKRAGAAALVEEDFGVVLVGGAAKGAGVERLEIDGKKFIELPYPADPVTGAALVMEDETHLLRVGGVTADEQAAPTVRIDIECSKDCVYEAVPLLDLTVLNAQSYFDPATKQTLVVGENAEGLTQVYRYQTTGFTEVTFAKTQRRTRALALELPTQELAIVGGTDPNNDSVSRQDISVIAF